MSALRYKWYRYVKEIDNLSLRPINVNLGEVLRQDFVILNDRHNRYTIKAYLEKNEEVAAHFKEVYIELVKGIKIIETLNGTYIQSDNYEYCRNIYMYERSKRLSNRSSAKVSIRSLRRTI